MPMPHNNICSEIKLSEKNEVPSRIQLMRTGKFTHERYGKIEITPERLKSFKENFDNNVRRLALAIDYKHENEDVAAGWIKSVELSEDGNELWGVIDWCPQGQKKLADKEFRYFSPEFSDQYTDNETGKVFKDVLLGGGLTNRPFLKGMNPIVALTENLPEKIQNELKELIVKKLNEYSTSLGVAPRSTEKETKKMDEKDKMIEELKAKIAELEAKLKGHDEGMVAMEKDKKALAEQVAKLEGEKKCAEKAAAFDKLLSEGKACVAQKEAFMSGDLIKFTELAQPLNLAPKGTNENAGEGDVTSKILKLAEEKTKQDKSLTLGKAVSVVLSENPELAKAYQG